MDGRAKPGQDARVDLALASEHQCPLGNHRRGAAIECDGAAGDQACGKGREPRTDPNGGRDNPRGPTREAVHRFLFPVTRTPPEISHGMVEVGLTGGPISGARLPPASSPYGVAPARPSACGRRAISATISMFACSPRRMPPLSARLSREPGGVFRARAAGGRGSPRPTLPARLGVQTEFAEPAVRINADFVDAKALG